MDRAQISAIAHAEHPIMAPLSEESVTRLLRALPVPPGASVTDVGCGRGAWLVRLLQQREDLVGIGIDTSQPALAAAREAAAAAGVGGRAQWLLSDVSTALQGPTAAALCVGATHAFGGLAPTLTALREHVRPGGSILLGEGFWEQPPTPRALETIGDLPDLATLTRTCHDHGFEVVDGHVSTAAEWDAYEWSWTGSLTRWALDHAGTEDGAAALAAAREHLDEWLSGYRRQLGFVTLVLREAGVPGS